MRIAVVLGNRLLDSGEPSPLMKKRTELCLALFKEQSPDFVILSGGVANKKAGKSEAQAMFELLKEKISEGKLLKEEQSKNTKQNALFAVKIAVEKGADELVLCTSKEHLTRWWLNPKKLFTKELKNTGIKLSWYEE